MKISELTAKLNQLSLHATFSTNNKLAYEAILLAEQAIAKAKRYKNKIKRLENKLRK